MLRGYQSYRYHGLRRQVHLLRVCGRNVGRFPMAARDAELWGWFMSGASSARYGAVSYDSLDPLAPGVDQKSMSIASCLTGMKV